jgi:hypothetical protein
VLIAAPEVLALVPADHIRAGSVRPENFPTIILTGGQTQFLGWAAGDQACARVYLDAHIWAVEDGADTARAIGMAVLKALALPPQMAAQAQRFSIDEWAKPGTIWLRDPQPELSYTHGVMSLEAAVRWAL